MTYRIFSVMLIFTCTACSGWMGIEETFFPSFNASSTQPMHATSGQRDACRAEAQQRLPLYVHSDIYPLTEQERADALSTLMSGCMRQYDTMATPASTSPITAQPSSQQTTPPQVTQPVATSNSPFGAPTPTTATPDVPFAVAQPAAPSPPAAPHKAIAAPVGAVSVTSSTPPAPPTPPPAAPTPAPFTTAVPPSPDLATRAARVTNPTLPPPPPTPHLDPGSAGAQQLEKIVDQP